VTRPPFDPNELDQPSTDADRAIAELESYLADTATGAPRGLGERVMAAIEQEPAPHRGFLSWLLTPAGANSGLRRVARAGVLAATLVVAIGGAIFAGQLTGLIRNVGSGSPTPVESVSPTPSESVMPSPSTSPVPTSSGSPEASEDAHQSPGATGTPGASEDETPEASSDGSGEGSKTPRPSATATATATATPGS
jgi:hypothetical protein